jgi:hypothetical protein
MYIGPDQDHRQSHKNGTGNKETSRTAPYV